MVAALAAARAGRTERLRQRADDGEVSFASSARSTPEPPPAERAAEPPRFFFVAPATGARQPKPPAHPRRSERERRHSYDPDAVTGAPCPGSRRRRHSYDVQLLSPRSRGDANTSAAAAPDAISASGEGAGGDSKVHKLDELLGALEFEVTRAQARRGRPCFDQDGRRVDSLPSATGAAAPAVAAPAARIATKSDAETRQPLATLPQVSAARAAEATNTKRSGK